MTTTLTMAQAADAAGYSLERFRRVWRQIPGFPAPIKAPHFGRGTYAWRAQSVQDWQLARERALGVGRAAPPAANEDRAPLQANAAAIARQRQALGRLMGSA